MESPVFRATEPLTPAVPAFAVATVTDPEDDISPRPLVIETDPPVATEDRPPAMSTLPPTSFTGSRPYDVPAEIFTAPPCPPEMSFSSTNRRRLELLEELFEVLDIGMYAFVPVPAVNVILPPCPPDFSVLSPARTLTLPPSCPPVAPTFTWMSPPEPEDDVPVEICIFPEVPLCVLLPVSKRIEPERPEEV